MSAAQHAPRGNPCNLCGRLAEEHRAPGARHTWRHRYRSYQAKRTAERSKFYGIDGEGQNDNGGKGRHRYTFLACSDEYGLERWFVRPANGIELSSKECLDFIMGLPNGQYHKIFSYSFNYDLTMMLKDLPDSTLYYLFRPDLRKRLKNPEMGPWPVQYEGYLLNLQGTKFTVKERRRKGAPARLVTIWDVFKFFQSKFTGALKEWKVGSEQLLARMTKMKDKRAEFDKISAVEVENYCFEECQCMAELARKLLQAHQDAGLTLKSYYGAGSSGGAMLDTMGIKEKVVAHLPPPEPMKKAIAQSFFGGRFENSVIGRVDETVYGYDISSAYPYQTCFLPCLEHARWERTTRRRDIDNARAALVRYGLENGGDIKSWGPFPYREGSGTISFPHTSGGGWVWHQEYLAGERLFPKSVEFREAWVYKSDCVCKPFERIPEFYLTRLSLGKDGAGIVIKLGINSCYGKLAQSIGMARYNCWIWAAMITSGCRAQMLELLGLHKDMSNALMIATDGCYTRERIIAPAPRDTKTGTPVNGKSKPLGGWEEKEHIKGVFIARPGIYFPLHPTEAELKDVRGRGIGKAIVYDHWDTIMHEYEKHGPQHTVVIHRFKDGRKIVRFCGAKTSISRTSEVTNWEEIVTGKARMPVWKYNRANGEERGGPSYGQWVPRPVEMSFNPRPKREGVASDGKTLVMRSYPTHIESKPYRKALAEPNPLAIAKDIIEEQPDKDLSTY